MRYKAFAVNLLHNFNRSVAVIVTCISSLQVPSDILPIRELPVKADGQGCALMQVCDSRIIIKDAILLIEYFALGRMSVPVLFSRK